MQQRAPVEGKVIVITGASSGFGKGAALRFAARGDAVVVAARRGDVLDELAVDCEAAGGRARAVVTDASDLQSVRRLAEDALSEFGRFDVWINNAGVGALGPFEKVPIEFHEQVIKTDLLGTLYGSWIAYQQFLRQGAGILINVASELGRHTVPYYASYAAAKHGMVGLSDSLRQEVLQQEHRDIHVCTVMPTAHDTPFFDHAANFTGHEVQVPTPLHDPANVVETLVRLADDPKDKEIVGADGVVKILMKSLAPGLTERLAARQMHTLQMKNAPPAGNSPGSVKAPSGGGTGVSGNRLAR
jgi:NAD(P)-dependent dehydrogenase (short-subunit alcohol dehydrogenase family)